MDEIRIDNLEVYAYHGVLPEENQKGQPFFINAILYLDLRASGLNDDITKTANYALVAELCHEFMIKNTYQLIETVAEKLAIEILTQFSEIQRLDLEIRKPYAPVGYPLESVSVRISRQWHHVYLSIGSNIGDRERYISDAIQKLSSRSDVREVNVSKLLVTKPYGGVEQEDFLNGAVAIQTLLTPLELLDVIHQIEKEAGRERHIHWGPRTLDLDIVFYDKEIMETDELVIPHIDMENRYFVLKPLSELAPNYRHPILLKTINQLLEAVKQ